MVIEIIIAAVLIGFAAYMLYRNIKKKNCGGSCCSSDCSGCSAKRDGN